MKKGISSRQSGNGSGNDVLERYVWRKDRNDKGKRLVDCNREELEKFAKICKDMLANKDTDNPGRMVLLDNIAKYRKNCNTELFIRFMSKKYAASRYNLYETFSAFVRNNQKNHADILGWPIRKVMDNIPADFRDITIREAMLACMDLLGTFSTQGLTKTFLCSIGISLSVEEWHGITPTFPEVNAIMSMEVPAFDKIRDASGKITLNKSAVIKYRNGIPMSYIIPVSKGGTGFSTQELSELMRLPGKCKYSEMSSTQLSALRDKALPRLELKIDRQIAQWKERLEQINRVARSKGYLTTT